MTSTDHYSPSGAAAAAADHGIDVLQCVLQPFVPVSRPDREQRPASFAKGSRIGAPGVRAALGAVLLLSGLVSLLPVVRR